MVTLRNFYSRISPVFRLILVFGAIMTSVTGTAAAAGKNADRASSIKQDCDDAMNDGADAALPYSDHEIETIWSARGHFRIEIYQGEIAGQTTTFLFAGEAHVKSKTAHLFGRALVAMSPFRAYEGVNSKAYYPFVASRFTNFDFYQLINKAAPDSFGSPSTIRDIQADVLFDAFHEELVRILSLEHQIKSLAELQSHLREWAKTPSFRSRLIPLAEEFLERVSALRVLSGMELDAALQVAIAEIVKPPFAPPGVRWPRNIHLEANHRAGLLENLAVFGVGQFGSYVDYLYQKAPQTTLRALRDSVKFLESHDHYAYKENRRGVLEGARNQSMVVRLLEALNEKPESKVLIVVGSAHVPGMVRLLQEAVPGLRRVRIPAPAWATSEAD